MIALLSSLYWLAQNSFRKAGQDALELFDRVCHQVLVTQEDMIAICKHPLGEIRPKPRAADGKIVDGIDLGEFLLRRDRQPSTILPSAARGLWTYLAKRAVLRIAILWWLALRGLGGKPYRTTRAHLGRPSEKEFCASQ